MGGYDFEIKVNNINEADARLTQGIENALEAMGMQVENHAKAKCPVDTGNLRNSITHTSDSESAFIGTDVFYSGYVELGTSRQDPQPYLRPAVEDHVDELKRIAEAMIQNAFQ
jgi:HK97 gp10 family phage protein